MCLGFYYYYYYFRCLASLEQVDCVKYTYSIISRCEQNRNKQTKTTSNLTQCCMNISTLIHIANKYIYKYNLCLLVNFFFFFFFCSCRTRLLVLVVDESIRIFLSYVFLIFGFFPICIITYSTPDHFSIRVVSFTLPTNYLHSMCVIFSYVYILYLYIWIHLCAYTYVIMYVCVSRLLCFFSLNSISASYIFGCVRNFAPT